MLRRRQDDTFEFRDIERALYSIQPPALAPERKDALRSRIMTSLGEQEALRQAGILTPVFRERWVAVPAGVGLAVAIIAGIRAYEAYGTYVGNDGDRATFAGQLSLDGAPVNELRPGPTFVAASETNVHLGHEVVLMLMAGASFSYELSGHDVTVFAGEGVSTVVTGERPVNVAGTGWSARLGVASAVQFSVSATAVTVSATDGLVRVTEVGGASHALAAGGSVTIRIGDGAPPEITPPADPLSSNGSSHGNGPAAVGEPPADDAEDGDAPASPGNSASKPGTVPAGPPKLATPVPPVPSAPADSAMSPTEPDAPEAPESSSPATDLPEDPQGPPDEVPAPIVPPGLGGEIPADPPGGGQPENPGQGNGNGNGEPPIEPPGGGPPGQPGSNGNGTGPGSNNGNGNGSANGAGPGSGNGQGNANGQGNGNGNQAMTFGGENPAPPFASEPDEGEADSADAGHNGNGNANGHDHAPGQQGQPESDGNGNGPGPDSNNGHANGAGSNGNGNAETNPGQGKGPDKKS